jgi:hypothetical protein
VKHSTSPRFRAAYEALPSSIRKLADANFALLKRNPRHPSLQFKKVDDIGPSASACATELWLSRRKMDMFGSGSARTPITID